MGCSERTAQRAVCVPVCVALMHLGLNSGSTTFPIGLEDTFMWEDPRHNYQSVFILLS
jgi:hypothetical protein